MATTPTRRTRAKASPALDAEREEMAAAIADVIPMHQRRVQTEYIDITDIVPYEWNPRKNEVAVAAVKKSIETFGFLIPCVIDRNGVLAAGHTRVEAAKQLGMTAVPCIIADFLTPEQINAFRLIDNKVAEQAEWDFDLLAGEINKLADLGLDFTEYGWSQEEIDCLSQMAADDCLSPTALLESNNAASGEGAEQHQRRAPLQTRIVIGEIVFFVTAQQYRNWADGIRELCAYDEDRIAAELKRRLAILD